ncbi:MAG: hypothetical protein ACO24U_02995 [Prochlorococcaceae cyanobacterium]|jgi:hypothetical protein
MKRLLAAALLMALAVCVALSLPAQVLAGPVNWIEVPSTEAGRQWWDQGSLRLNSSGTLNVLSRFEPAAAGSSAEGGASKQRILGTLYVMEIDCGQALYRDTSVNGLPQWGAQWQPVAGDGLIADVLQGSCAAAGLAQSVTPGSPILQPSS